VSDPYTGIQCHKCGKQVSLEVGITSYGNEAESHLYCTPCSPGGKGYTLSDLQQMRTESREAFDKVIRDREVRLMEQMGPDVYFHVLGNPSLEEPS